MKIMSKTQSIEIKPFLVSVRRRKIWPGGLGYLNYKVTGSC